LLEKIWIEKGELNMGDCCNHEDGEKCCEEVEGVVELEGVTYDKIETALDWARLCLDICCSDFVKVNASRGRKIKKEASTLLLDILSLTDAEDFITVSDMEEAIDELLEAAADVTEDDDDDFVD
jgi:hypothetical protein